MNYYRIFWIDNSALYMKYYSNDWTNSVLIDSPNCSSPDANKNDVGYDYKFLYVKQIEREKA